MEGGARGPRELVTAASEPPPFADPPLARLVGATESYVLVRFVLLRLLGLVYAVAFLVTALQGPALIGDAGLLPAGDFLRRVAESVAPSEAFFRLPTLFWLGFSDAALSAVSWSGFALAVAVMLGAENALLQLALWALYLSIAQVGQRFYGYGWESQLLETGFLSIFLCPARTLRPFASAPPFVAILLGRWLIARIMLGAGLIKIRGDACWTELTCLDFHYETQPIPHPLSPYFHALPAWFQRISVLFNHGVELAAPFLCVGPRRARLVAGTLFVGFQGLLIASGNLAFLNWLTIVPAVACFDDRALGWLLRRSPSTWTSRPRPTSTAQRRASVAYAAVVAALSINPVTNLLSPRQAMNRSFDPLHLVNTYGAFGSVGRVRHEVVLEGTASAEPSDDAAWRAYELPCKPGRVDRPHCWITPYHRRLDWQMWFAALGSPGREPWLVHLAAKLLRGDPGVLTLFSESPFPDSPPRWVRATFWRYEMTSPWEGGQDRWRRTYVGPYLPPVRLGDPALVEFLERHGWRSAP